MQGSFHMQIPNHIIDEAAPSLKFRLFYTLEIFSGSKGHPP
jgi:hypothetical protein